MTSSPEFHLLPEGFEMLEPWAADWALETQAEREAKRRASISTELTAFYEAVMPHVHDILAEVAKFPIGGLPEAHGRLFSLAFSLNEVAHNVERYEAETLVITDFDEARFIASHSLHPTWTGRTKR